MSNQERMKIDDITVDKNIQQRANHLDIETVARYCEAIELDGDRGWPFPPVVVFRNAITNEYLLADGFHRIAAAIEKETERVLAEIRHGDRDAAIQFAIGANAGLGRTAADKRKAVTTALENHKWQEWSDREVARRCRVSRMTVGRVRASLSQRDSAPLETVTSDTSPLSLSDSAPPKPKAFRKTKDGRTMNVTNIGARPKAKPKLTPQKATERAYNRFIGACSDLRDVNLSKQQKFKVAQLCRDTLIHYLPDLDPKDASQMVEKICNRTKGVHDA